MGIIGLVLFWSLFSYLRSLTLNSFFCLLAFVAFFFFFLNLSLLRQRQPVVGMVNSISHCYNVSVNRPIVISLESSHATPIASG